MKTTTPRRFLIRTWLRCALLASTAPLVSSHPSRIACLALTVVLCRCMVVRCFRRVVQALPWQRFGLSWWRHLRLFAGRLLGEPCE